MCLCTHIEAARLKSSQMFQYVCSKRNPCLRHSFTQRHENAEFIFKGAACRILTLLKHKNTIICLQIFKKHAKLTYCLSEKQCYSQLFSFENVRSGPECLCLLWFVIPAHCQFTQLYFGTAGCQLAENTEYLISFIIM